MGDQPGGVFDVVKQISERLCFPPSVTASGTRPNEVHPSAARWSLARIRASFEPLRRCSLAAISKLLRAYGVRERQGRAQYYSPDPDYLRKEACLLEALGQVAAHPGSQVALFLDEMSHTRWPDPSSHWCPEAPVPRPLAQRKESRYQRYRVVGALDAMTGRVCYLHDSRISREVFSRFLRQLDQAYPQAETIYLVWDNWPVHHSEIVKQALASLPRMRVVPLPTYAPWLNPIEKLWRNFRQEIDYLHDWAHDWGLLRKRVRQFFDQFADGSRELLTYVGLRGQGKLAQALRAGP